VLHAADRPSGAAPAAAAGSSLKGNPIMAKAKTSPGTKAAKRSSKCSRHTVKFTTKRGKVIEFAGRLGKTCGPRPKPKTGHLRHYKSNFAKAAKHCKGNSRGAFINCMRSSIPR
jgi:hypothetical protein